MLSTVTIGGDAARTCRWPPPRSSGAGGASVAPVRGAAVTDGGRRRSCVDLDLLVDGSLEVVAPLAVGPVPVERGAAGRQQDGVARARRGRRRRARRRPSTSAVTTGRVPANAALDLGGRLADGDDGRGCGRWRDASGARSRPLLRPPAMSTTESKPARAASVAWGAVAFESSYQRTPPASPTSSTRWGRPAKLGERRPARRRGRHRRRAPSPPRPGRWRGRAGAHGAGRRPGADRRRRGHGADRRPTCQSASAVETERLDAAVPTTRAA